MPLSPFPEKKIKTKLTIAKARSAIIKPTNAATRVLLAESILPLSPPEVIQRIPPIIKKNKQTRIAITIRNVKITPTRPPSY